MATAILSPFTVAVSGSWHRDEIPPRCRKPRSVYYESTVEVDIPHVTSADAPVAVRVEETWPPLMRDYRLYEGNLYRQHLTSSREPIGVDGDLDSIRTFSSTHEARLYGATAEFQLQEYAQNWAASHLIIDGMVWVKCGEPRYVVMTFGLGHNHGGTSLMADYHDNENILAESYFRADEYEEALAHAVRVAKRRGDNESIPRFKPLIEVLIPEAITLITVPAETDEQLAARREYRRAVDALHEVVTSRGQDRPDADSREESAFKAVKIARKKVLDLQGLTVAASARPVEGRHQA